MKHRWWRSVMGSSTVAVISNFSPVFLFIKIHHAFKLHYPPLTTREYGSSQRVSHLYSNVILQKCHTFDSEIDDEIIKLHSINITCHLHWNGWNHKVYWLTSHIPYVHHFFSIFHCSQCVPMRLSKMFPKVPEFYLIRFAQSSTLIFVSILQLVVQRGVTIGECLMFQKYWWQANQYDSFKE